MAVLLPADQRAVWDRMVTEAHPWLAIIKSKADKDGTSSTCYASRGRWSGLYYLISGDPAYARRSYDYLGTTNGNYLTPTRPGNETREHTIEQVMIFDWIGQALTESEQQTFRTWLTKTADGMFTYGLRRSDSDQVSGSYGFFALLDTVCGTDYLTRSIKDPNTNTLFPLGGLDATAADRSTIRNCVRQYIEVLGAGGQWIESQEYNLGTPNLLYMTWVGLKTALGTDHLPEFAAWLPQARIYHRHELRPGLTCPFQWSDVQDVRGMHWVNRDTTYAFLRAGDSGFNQFAADVDAALGRTLPSASAPSYPRYFYYADPYAEKTLWISDTPLLHVTHGTGHAYWRTGWATADRATHFMCPSSSKGSYVDHFPNQFGTIQIARAGKFLLTHPISYTPPHTCPNALLVCNSPPSREAGGLTAWAYDPGVLAYAAGTNCGKGWDVTGTYYPPPTYLHEHTRAVVELLDGPDTVVVIYDRVFCDDPRTQVMTSGGGMALTRYPAAAQARMKAALGLKDLLFHTPVKPTLTVEHAGFSWRVPNTTWTVCVQQVLPERALGYTIVDETNPPLDVAVSERKWCVHAVPPPDETLPAFEVFLHVLTASEGTAAVTATPLGTIVSEGETIVSQGVLVSRPDHVDVAILFSAKVGPTVTLDQADLGIVTTARLLTTTFSVTLPRPATVYLADLDPAVTWQATCADRQLQITRMNDLVRVTGETGGVLTLWANEEPPTPPPVVPEWTITEQTPTRIVLERVR